MLPSMFGMGGTEILVILVVALLFLGPDKLPEAAKKISQGIRDIKKQTRVLQRTIEDDEHIGGAIRDLKSALRGDDEPIRPVKARAIEAAAAVVALPEPPAETPNLLPASVHEAVTAPHGVTAYEAAADDAVAAHAAANAAATTYAAAITSTEPAEVVAATAAPHAATEAAAAKPALTLPPTAGEPDDDAPRSTAADNAVLAALVRPAPNTIARAPRRITRPAPIAAEPAPIEAAPADPSEPEHG
jgi:sec-independent protein translocase protein TatB